MELLKMGKCIKSSFAANAIWQAMSQAAGVTHLWHQFKKYKNKNITISTLIFSIRTSSSYSPPCGPYKNSDSLLLIMKSVNINFFFKLSSVTERERRRRKKCVEINAYISGRVGNSRGQKNNWKCPRLRSMPTCANESENMRWNIQNKH